MSNYTTSPENRRIDNDLDEILFYEDYDGLVEAALNLNEYRHNALAEIDRLNAKIESLQAQAAEDLDTMQGFAGALERKDAEIARFHELFRLTYQTSQNKYDEGFSAGLKEGARLAPRS